MANRVNALAARLHDPQETPVPQPPRRRGTRLRNTLFFATVIAALVVGFWLIR